MKKMKNRQRKTTLRPPLRWRNAMGEPLTSIRNYGGTERWYILLCVTHSMTKRSNRTRQNVCRFSQSLHWPSLKEELSSYLKETIRSQFWQHVCSWWFGDLHKEENVLGHGCLEKGRWFSEKCQKDQICMWIGWFSSIRRHVSEFFYWTRSIYREHGNESILIKFIQEITS